MTILLPVDEIEPTIPSPASSLPGRPEPRGTSGTALYIFACQTRSTTSFAFTLIPRNKLIRPFAAGTSMILVTSGAFITTSETFINCRIKVHLRVFAG